MRIRFEETVATPGWSIPAGAVISVSGIPSDSQLSRWLECGTIRIVRDPDADLETPEGSQDFEKASTETRPFVPRLCPAGTVVCVATGPSLTADDVTYCRDKAFVIAINDAYRLAPWAGLVYGCDAKWWNWHKEVAKWPCLKFGLKAVDLNFPAGVALLENTGITGLERKPTGLRNGKNSGYQAINVAVHLGASRILLLGYDMKLGPGGRSHFFGEHPDGLKPTISNFVGLFESIVEPLKKRHIEVVNCSRQTALTCFPRMPIEAALPVEAAVA